MTDPHSTSADARAEDFNDVENVENVAQPDIPDTEGSSLEGSSTDTVNDSHNDTTEKSAIILMSALIVLAVIASIIMLFVSSTAWMKIGVLAALWAAVIGAVLVTRYRRQLGAERNHIEQLQELHKVELERELATHREQELILEQNYLDSLDVEQDDMISQLRAEIVALREQLSELLGESFDDEQVALRARAERLRQIDAPAASPLKDPKGDDRPEPRAAAHRNELRASGAVGTHTHHGVGQQTEETPAAEATPEPQGAHRAVEPDTSQPPVEVDEVRGRGFDTSSFKAVHWKETPRDTYPGAGSAGDSEVSDEPTRQLQAVPDEQVEEQTPSRHGRRRAEENKQGLTVAEIMAQMRNSK